MLSSSPIFCCSKYNAASLSWQMCEIMALYSLKDNINCTSNFWFEISYLSSIAIKYSVFRFHTHKIINALFKKPNLHSINSKMSWFGGFYELRIFVFIHQKLLPYNKCTRSLSLCYSMVRNIGERFPLSLWN